MKRLLVAVAAVGLAGALTSAAANADSADPVSGSPAVIAGFVPDVFNPPSGESRHVCVIHDRLDFYRCVYIPFPFG